MTAGLKERTGQVTPTWSRIIRDAVRAGLLEARVSMPAVVVSYDPETRTCSVQPSFSESFLDDDQRESIPLP